MDLYRTAKHLALAFALILSTPTVWAQSLIRDAEIEHTLRAFTDPILVAAGLEPRDVEMYIISDPSLNAFVANGQKIHLHTGLIIASETPGQLKGVIAHETGHIAGGHGARRVEAARLASRPALVSIGLGIIAIAAGAPDAGAALIASSQQFAALNFFTFTRVQEASADQAAIDYLEETGQSPAGLVEFFENFRYQEVLSEARRYPYFRTHPLASDRIQSLRQRAEKTGLMQVAESPEDIERMDMMRAKLIGFLQPSARVYQRYPSDDLSRPARYARAIAAYRSVDVSTALQETGALIAEEPENPYFHELLGQILFENGRTEESVAPNERALELAPDEPLLKVNLARSLVARAEETDLIRAEDLLRDALVFDQENAFAWHQLSIALERQGRRSEAELATAEQAYYLGNYERAFQFARRATEGLSPDTPPALRAADIAKVTAVQLQYDRRG